MIRWQQWGQHQLLQQLWGTAEAIQSLTDVLFIAGKNTKMLEQYFYVFITEENWSISYYYTTSLP